MRRKLTSSAACTTALFLFISFSSLSSVWAAWAHNPSPLLTSFSLPPRIFDRRFITFRRAARRKQAAAQGPPAWLSELSHGLADPSWIARKEAIENAAARSKTAQGGKSRPHKAVLRALCRAVVDEVANVRAAAVEALAGICPCGDTRAVEYLAKLLPPHHGGGPGGAHGVHSLGVGEWRGQLCVLEAIKRTMHADGERARDIVKEFAGLLRIAEEGRELYAIPQGGIYEVTRDELSRPILLKVMGEGGATVWTRLAEMR